MAGFSFRNTIHDDGIASVLPVQWRDMHAVPTEQGAAALAAGVIVEAWLTSLRPIPPLPPGTPHKSVRRTYRQNIEAQQEAVRWFNDDSREPFSFRYLCEHLSLDHIAIRLALNDALKQSSTTSSSFPPQHSSAARVRAPAEISSTARSLGHRGSLIRARKEVEFAIAD